MKRCECCFTFRLDCAVGQLAVLFHPDSRICAVSVEEASQTAEAAAQHAGSGHADTYGILGAVAVKISVYKLVNHGKDFIHGGGNLKI